MASPILVTGGTGTLGRVVTRMLREAGHEVRVLSRHGGRDDARGPMAGDLTTGEGVDAAVAGTLTVVHCAGTHKGDDGMARQLIQAASRAGVQHVVFISVVGADRIPVDSAVDRAMFGYFASKHAAEQVVAESGLPWTILRATQFHDLTWKVAQQMARLPVIPVAWGFRFQPVDEEEVGARLVELALGPPSGLVPDFAGPRSHPMAELLGTYLRAQRKRRPIVPLWLPGKAARAIRAGANLSPERAVGARTWEDYVTVRTRLGPRSPATVTLRHRPT